MRNGVYQIRNLRNSKIYIGSSSFDLDRRWMIHQRGLRAKKHHSVKLQNAWLKHGVEAFVFEILEKCLPGQCVEREQFYLNELLFANCNDARFDQLGYNICREARSCLGIKRSQTTKEKIRVAQQGINGNNARLTEEQVKEILLLRLEGQSYRQIAERFAMDYGNIGRIVRGKIWSNIVLDDPEDQKRLEIIRKTAQFQTSAT